MNSPATPSPIPVAEQAPVKSSRGLDFALAATATVSAWLIFQVQPMVAKRILPWFGGGTAVWTTVMLFFQSALFVGYLYAHLATKWFAPRRQIHVHVALLAAAAMLAIIVGVLPGDAWRPAGGEQPALHILVMLAASVGLPYLSLAATAPLTQVWFARIHPGRSPYRLYALSNAGSLAALLSYPFLFEPNLGVADQGIVWASLFIIFALLCAWSGLASLRSIAKASAGLIGNELPATEPDSPSDAAPRRSRRIEQFFWLALPASASVALLAITNHLCQDILSVPLLWIAPMVVYLLSFILTFDSDRWYRRDVWLPIGAIASFAAPSTWLHADSTSLGAALTVNLVLLMAICMICHGELARQRPAPQRLTLFYLSIAGGGAIGGFLASIVAPLLFHDYFELQGAVVVTWVLSLALLVTDRQSPFFDGGKGLAFVGVLVMAALFVAVDVTMYVHSDQSHLRIFSRERSFYGVLKLGHVRVGQDDEYIELTNGRIAHGAQFQADSYRRIPMWYYNARSGPGQLLAENVAGSPRRVGVIGLGAGTLAAYAEANDHFRFYDINAQVFDVAEENFSYLQDARERGATVELIAGDGRIALENEPPQNFDMLILDAFNGDSIPAHLLALEAFELYLRHLKEPDGVLAVHVSSIHLLLPTVVKAAAERFQLDAAFVTTPPDETPAARGCDWILLSRQPGQFADIEGSQPLTDYRPDRPPVVWTDDYSSLLDVLND